MVRLSCPKNEGIDLETYSESHPSAYNVVFHSFRGFSRENSVCRETTKYSIDNSASTDVSLNRGQTKSRDLLMIYDGRIVKCEGFCEFVTD
jgi:hypothetical protein